MAITHALIKFCDLDLLLVDIFRIQKIVNSMKMLTSNTDLHKILSYVGLRRPYHNVLQYFRLGNIKNCLFESLKK